MKNGKYRLVQELGETGERVYFNFEARQFYDYTEKENKQVSLATIDSLTTAFSSEKEFIDLLKNSGFDTDISTMFITYKYKGERKLAPVFNDPLLNGFARSTIGREDGSINVNDPTIRNRLYRMFKILIVPGNELFERIDIKRRMNSNTYGISSHNYEFLAELPNNVYYGSVNDERFHFAQFVRHFSSYKEFRALHLNYVAYEKKKKEEMDKQGIKTYAFREEP